MKDRTACILDGGPSVESATTGASETLVELLGERGWTATIYTLRDLAIAPCLGCFSCWVKTPGVCIIDDVAREIARTAIGSELLAFVTPITFGGYSSELKKGIDRMIPLILPYFTFVGSEVHHIRRYPKAPNILGVGILPRPDEEQERIFRTLIRRNSINYHAPDAESFVGYEGDTGIRAGIGEALDEVIER